MNPPPTVFGRARERTLTLARALGLEERLPAIEATLAAILPRLHDRLLSSPPRWSGLSDDCTPWELSIVLRPGAFDVRLLYEAQADPASPSTYWEAGLALTRALPGVELARFEEIAPLFAPTEPDAYWALWNAVDFGRGAVPMHKIYLNALGRGAARSTALVREAMGRLGFASAAERLLAALDPTDQLTHVSLDLGAQASRRLKIYVRHRHASVERLEALFRDGDSHEPGDVRLLAETALGASDFSARPVFGVFHFVDPKSDRAARTTLNVPTIPYAASDKEIAERLALLTERLGLDPEPYRIARATLFGHLDLRGERGLHSYLSLQRDAGRPRLTIYFGAMLYRDRFGLHGIDPQRTWPSPIDEEV